MNLADRFWAKVEKRGPDDCWKWTGSKDPRSYGRFKVDSGPKLAHRVTYELTHGPIPHKDLEGNRVCVLHRCDTPPCCNPGHLRTGTHAENMAESASRGRARNAGKRGEGVGTAKLTTGQVLNLRQQAQHKSQRALAAEFGISQASVWAIVNRKTWSHV